MLILALEVIVFAHLIWLAFSLMSRLTLSLGLALFLFAFLIGIEAASGSGPDWWISGPGAFPSLLLATANGALAFAVLGSPERISRSDWSRTVIGIAGGIVSVAFVCLWLIASFSSFDPSVPWPLPAVIGLAVAFFGLAVVRRNSTESGEAFLPELVRSYDYSVLIAALFGGQVVLAMWAGPGASDAMVWLLLGTITAAIGTQVYLDRIQGLLDRIAFANLPWLRQERAELRKIENLLPRVNMTDPLTIEEEEFSRLTRRALSNFGDLTKLATSPLTGLPEVHRRLLERGVESSTLERARELKVVLAEAIEQLKPRTGGEHGTTDEWRFYNALYYPYVVGMRPYSTTAVHSFDDPNHYEILEWFRTYVPERTLYNWQNSAAALIAGHLREREEVAASPDARRATQFTTAR